MKIVSLQIITSLCFCFISGILHSQADSFTVIIFSDTQYYSQKDGQNGFPETYAAQCTWVADNASSENIVFSIHMGDMTHTNTIAEWEKASAAHQILDVAGMPYSVVPGNHDYPGGGSVDSGDSQRYNDYFGQDRFTNAPWYGGAYENDNDNNYCFFSAGTYDFMVISLEFAPSKDVLCWANDLIEQHPEHNVILATHCYKKLGDHQDNCAINYDVVGSDGGDIWRELARRHSNVQLVLSGHVAAVDHEQRIGNAGNVVNEILTDYQAEKYNGEKYGNGWLRKLVFHPTEGTIEVESFTVLDDIQDFNFSTYPSDPNDPAHKYIIEDVVLNTPYTRYEISRAFNDMNVNSNPLNDQLVPSIDMAKNGDFVVVWEDESGAENQYQIFARGFDSNGCEKFQDILVNQVSSGNHYTPNVTVKEDGSFIVVWADDSDGNGIGQIKARMFSEYGIPQSGNITVNQIAAGHQRNPCIASDQEGNFVVVWEDDQENDGNYQIYAAGFDYNQTKNIDDFIVNQNTNGQHLFPDVTMTSEGDYIIAWQDDSDGNAYYQIYSKAFSAETETGYIAQFTVNQVANGQQLKPKIDSDGNGEFTIVWEDDSDNDGFYQIYAASFDESGQRVTDDFAVNQNNEGQKTCPTITKTEAGLSLISWEDDSDDNGFYQIYAATFDSENIRVNDDQVINENGSGQQLSPVIAASIYNWVVAWEDDLDNNGNFQILGRGYDSENAPPICNPMLIFNNLDIPSNVYQVGDQIISNGTIPSGNNVTFDAKNIIMLNAGFYTQSASNFTAIIGGCELQTFQAE